MKYVCKQCGWSGPVDGVLTAPNPFNPGSMITGCIRCFAVNSMSCFVQLIKSIYDYGEDHHPPGYIAQAGDIVIVKENRGTVLVVTHEGNPGAFLIYPGEYE